LSVAWETLGEMVRARIGREIELLYAEEIDTATGSVRVQLLPADGGTSGGARPAKIKTSVIAAGDWQRVR
jgi:hypothetical protein